MDIWHKTQHKTRAGFRTVAHWFVHSKNQETESNCCLTFLTLALEWIVERLELSENAFTLLRLLSFAARLLTQIPSPSPMRARTTSFLGLEIGSAARNENSTNVASAFVYYSRRFHFFLHFTLGFTFA